MAVDRPEGPDAGRGDAAADRVHDQDDLFMEQARLWYARQSADLRDWPMGLADEPDFVRAIDDEG